MTTKLYVVPGSHPSMSGRLMLEHKGIPYRRVDLVPALHKLALPALGFRRATVPALRHDGRRVQGTLALSRYLDEVAPDPPLFPPDAEARTRVEEAERWGEADLQPLARRVAWWAVRGDRRAAASFLEGARLPVPHALAVRTAPLAVLAEVAINRATGRAVRADLEALPGMLDHVDALLGAGVLGGSPPNAADFQIATSLRLLLNLDDTAPAIAGRPCEAWARALVPAFPGHAASR